MIILMWLCKLKTASRVTKFNIFSFVVILMLKSPFNVSYVKLPFLIIPGSDLYDVMVKTCAFVWNHTIDFVFYPFQQHHSELFDIVMILSFRTDMPGQKVQTQIRLLLFAIPSASFGLITLW